MKKALLILVSLMLVVSLAACAPADEGDAVAPEITATAAAEDAGSTAADLLNATMDDSDITYTFENGMYDNINGFANGDENSWFFYVNDALSTVGAADYTLAEGDVIELRYEATSNIDNLPLDDENAPVDGEDANTPVDENTPVDGEDANTPADENTPVDGEDANAPVDGETTDENTNVDGETTPAE